jgi:sarcosine oxidase
VARDADIVVVGAGIVGAAAARALAGAFATVVLVEQHELGHDRGSSHGTSRIFRLNYPEARYVRMALAASNAWGELEREHGRQLVRRSGSLDFGPVADETARALAACSVPYETLGADDVRERWPLLLEPDETAVFQPDGGILLADRAHEALVASAAEGGVEVRAHTPLRALALEPRGVRVLLDDDELAARAVVVTAGAWAPGLLAEVGIELPVVPTRETVVYLDRDDAEDLPSVIDYARTPSPGTGGIARVGRAGYALAAPGAGLKAGLHHSGPVADPNDDPVPDDRVAAWVTSWAASRYDGDANVRGVETCLYTNTADEGFVLERHGRVVIGSACSGHGFKFAPVVGRTLAALAHEAAS